MDIVDTCNRLIPSDQLDDSLLIGQNLECEASNEFGSLVQLEESLKNMLSDKDPMLGSASSQFNLLDNEDSSFQIAGPTGLEVAATEPGLSDASGELKSTETAVVKRSVGRPRKPPRHLESEETDGQGPTKKLPTGRPGRKPVNRLKKSFLIEKGVKGTQLKKELTEGGRININDLNVGLWINPVVVLKPLTVTVGGVTIELLPGPSYAANADAGQCFEDTFSYCGGIQYAMLQDDAQDTAQENQTNLGGIDNMSTDDVPLGLGPYVNPNEVQAANGALMRSPRTEETKLDNQSSPTKHTSVSAEKEAVKQPQNTHGNKTDSNSKDKEKTLGQKQLKPKPGPLRSKNLCRPSSTMKGPKSPQNKPSKIIHAPGVNRGKTLNEKKDVSLKRHGEEVQNEHAPKVQKMQDKHANKVKPKLPGASGAAGKKSPSSSDGGPAEPQGPTKNSHVGPKPESSQPAHGATAGHSSRSTEDGGQEKSKVKKPEKILQRQKSKTVRSSLSVDEPQLFIPDNAPPVVKKETVEEETASGDTAWEGNNCGLCKTHHNNTFMVGCGRCDDWFHGDCVGLDLTKVREMEEEDQMYVCLKCCEEPPADTTQSTAKPEAKPDVQDNKPPPKPTRQGPQQLPTSPGARPVKKESERKQSTEVKDTSQKTGVPPKLEMKRKTSSPGLKKPVSVDEIRRSVRDSLKEILLQRLKDSDLKITSEKASEVAKKTERELFHLYKDTDSKYKNKYRSLMFNLKDTKNNVLFKRVLKGEISPAQLIRMSPEELASKELAAWRKRENRHTIEMIEKQEREVERRPITKITHKGEIEIESQEPAKTSETVEVEPEPAPKVTEAPLDLLPLENVESTRTAKDTTAQHKSHLFDLHCKICTGRMAPPVEEAPTKVVATTVVRRQSAPSEEAKSTTPPVKDEDLHLTVLEESFRNAKSFVSEGRSEFTSGRDEETAFLSNLKSLWRGFVNMPAVAKLVTKVFPVSGIFDNLTEDLPDSIQIGGRISPQIVWDYLEKIRATGTKEVCLIRFSPETEEDEISYTLLFAYFSSRKRFGVVANNLKKVKDMYIIPLGATEKVPHQLVPFDGPGLENNRCNLLLGLLIRQSQGPKKDFLPVDINETPRIIPESKPPSVSTQDIRAVKQEEKRYLTSLAPAPAKEDKLLNATEDADEPVTESFEEASATEEGGNQESNKPLRFLPGVLVGWGGELPPLPDVGGKPKPAVDPSQRTPPAPKADAATPGTFTKSPTAAARLDRFVIKKKEPKPVQAEPGLSSPTAALGANMSVVKDAVALNQGASVSLKDKPPDVSTEAFLASLSSLSTAQGGNDATGAIATKKGEVSLPPETEKSNPDGNSLSLSKPQATTTTDQTNSLKPPISGILKKCSAYSNVTEEKKTEAVPEATANNPAPFVPQPVPVLTSIRHDPAVVSRQEEPQSNLSSSHTEGEGPSISQANISPALVAPTAFVPSAQQPQAVSSYTATRTETADFQYESAMAPVDPTFSNAAPFPAQQPPPVPGSCVYPCGGPPPNVIPPAHLQDQNHAPPPWAHDGPVPHHAPPGPLLPYADGYSSNEPPSSAKDYKRSSDEYSDPWERPRHPEDRDQQGRHRHHSESRHGKKSRHHERAKKHEYRDGSRHAGHTDDRHGERRKERHHSDEYRAKEKDRHRHRRDSDYENGRRNSKDS